MAARYGARASFYQSKALNVQLRKSCSSPLLLPWQAETGGLRKCPSPRNPRHKGREEHNSLGWVFCSQNTCVVCESAVSHQQYLIIHLAVQRESTAWEGSDEQLHFTGCLWVSLQTTLVPCSQPRLSQLSSGQHGDLRIPSWLQITE